MSSASIRLIATVRETGANRSSGRTQKDFAGAVETWLGGMQPPWIHKELALVCRPEDSAWTRRAEATFVAQDLFSSEGFVGKRWTRAIARRSPTWRKRGGPG